MLDHPSLKVTAIQIKLELLLQGIHNLNLIILLGCQTITSSSFHIDPLGVDENTHDENLQEIQKLMNEISTNGALAAAFSSALIYAHAMCETILMDICELIRRVDCDAWGRYIGEKKVSFSDVSEKSIEEVRDNLIVDFLEILDRKPLLEKVEKLLGVLQPKNLSGIVPDFEYSKEELKEIDDLRHKCTHKPNWTEPLGTLKEVEEKVTYLANLGKMLLSLVIQKYSIPKLSELPKSED